MSGYPCRGKTADGNVDLVGRKNAVEGCDDVCHDKRRRRVVRAGDVQGKEFINPPGMHRTGGGTNRAPLPAFRTLHSLVSETAKGTADRWL